MKRAVVMGVIVAGLIGFVASRRSDRDGVRTGVWSGKTSQGLRIEIKVGKRGGNAVVEEWRIRFDSSCEKSGRVLRMLLLARATIPIVGGKFARELKFVGTWDRKWFRAAASPPMSTSSRSTPRMVFEIARPRRLSPHHAVATPSRWLHFGAVTTWPTEPRRRSEAGIIR